MARYRRARVNWGFVVVVSALLALVVVISLADVVDFGGRVPSWDDIFADTGLSEPMVTDAEASVHVIDVGQGDSILIKTPEHNILIDAGLSESGSHVVSYLESQQVKTIDYLIISHPHADHIGGMAYVVEQMDVRHVIAPRVPESLTPTSKAYFSLLTAISDKGLKIKTAKAGDYYDMEDGAGFTILGPVTPDENDLNSNSVVLKFEYGEVSFLLTGDCETGEEMDILESGADVRADVLKLGHHGSGTSTGKAWLAAVSPRWAAISCGLDNSYGHPHREVLERLSAKGVETHRTDLEGTIVFETDGGNIRVAGGAEQKEEDGASASAEEWKRLAGEIGNLFV